MKTNLELLKKEMEELKPKITPRIRKSINFGSKDKEKEGDNNTINSSPRKSVLPSKKVPLTKIARSVVKLGKKTKKSKNKNMKKKEFIYSVIESVQNTQAS